MKTRLLNFLYQHLAKKFFFLFDPESVHDRIVKMGKFIGGFSVGQNFTKWLFEYENKMLEQTIAGIHFKNPIGLAAGFDKNAELTKILGSVGFGFEEVGSITGQPCPGNKKPRLWRLKKSKSLLVYYGLKNDGCEVIASRLLCSAPNPVSEHGKSLLGKKQPINGHATDRMILGISIAKTNNQKTVDEAAGIADYVKAYKTFVEKNIGDYFTINISCPNTFGGEPFVEPRKLEKLLAAIRAVPSDKPIFLKMPAELSEETLDRNIELARKYKLTGFISTNLAKSRSNPTIIDDNFPTVGGMSGKVVQKLSDDQISYLYKKTKGEFVIIGCGGVFTAEDAYRKIKLGASLIQMITGMIYQGPQVVGEINRGLVELLKKAGYKSISEAVGKGV